MTDHKQGRDAPGQGKPKGHPPTDIETAYRALRDASDEGYAVTAVRVAELAEQVRQAAIFDAQRELSWLAIDRQFGVLRQKVAIEAAARDEQRNAEVIRLRDLAVTGALVSALVAGLFTGGALYLLGV